MMADHIDRAVNGLQSRLYAAAREAEHLAEAIRAEPTYPINHIAAALTVQHRLIECAKLMDVKRINDK